MSRAKPFLDYEAFDALGLAELVHKHEVSPEELLEAALLRVERLNPTLNAVVIPMEKEARESIEADLQMGPFRGVPFLLKDLGCGNRAGDPIHWGTRFLRDAWLRSWSRP